MLKRLILRGGSTTLNAIKAHEECDFAEEEYKSADTALYLICRKDGKGCPMLKAALSALQTSPDVNLLSRHTKRDERTNYRNKSALYVAVCRRNIEMVKLLLIHGADPLHCAVIGHSVGDSDSDGTVDEEQGTVLTALDVLERKPYSEWEQALHDAEQEGLRRQREEKEAERVVQEQKQQQVGRAAAAQEELERKKITTREAVRIWREINASKCDYLSNSENSDDECASRDKDKEELSQSLQVEAKTQITALLKSNSKWFPELIDYYPKRMSESVSIIVDALSEEQFPDEIINFVIDYFYAL